MYHVDVSNQEGYVFTVKSKDYEFKSDMNGAQGIKPPEALLASLGTCIGVYVRKYAEGGKLSIPELSISVDADYDKDKPLRFRKITVAVDLKGVALEERRLAALRDFIKNCPVHNTLKAVPEIDIEII